MRKRMRKAVSMLLLLIMICGAVFTGAPPAAMAEGEPLPEGGQSFGDDLETEAEVDAVMAQAFDAFAAEDFPADIDALVEEAMQQAFAEIAAPFLEEGYGTDGKFLAPIGAPDPGAIPIYTAQDLYDIRNNLRGFYVLMNDIDLSTFNGGKWTPIGDNSGSSRSFSGTFDGQGHIIRNLTITGDYQSAGLFGYVSGVTIKNVGLEDTDINIDSSSNTVYAGGIYGYSSTASTVSNCFNSGIITASSSYYYYSYAGGICGLSSASPTTISSCYNSGTVTASSSSSSAYAGGICGRSYTTVSISNCYNSGSIMASSSSSVSAGGICGSASTISNCYNSGSVATSTSSSDLLSIGGICGSASTISNCYNSGSIMASSSSFDVCAGGICGTTSAISNCYNNGSVAATSSSPYEFYSSYAGGICGYFDSNTNISNCYNKGSVSSSAYSGGICGYVYLSATINNCYNSGAVSASSSSYSGYAGGICGYFTATINNCYNSGTVSASSSYSGYAGGICSYSKYSNCTINNCYNSGTVTASSSSYSGYAGGICSYTYSSISNCYNSGAVSASSSSSYYSYAGGICGILQYSSITISNCYNSGSIMASSSSSVYAGGICSSSCIISNCYNSGSIMASSSSSVYAGGICSDADYYNYNSKISNCYWMQESPQIVNDVPRSITEKRGIGSVPDTETGRLASEQMKDPANFIGFDFDEVWAIDTDINGGFPFLRGGDRVIIFAKKNFLNHGKLLVDTLTAFVRSSFTLESRPKGHEVQWTVSDASVAKIESVAATSKNLGSAARIRVLKPGKTTIKASLPGGVSDEFTLTVEKDASHLIVAASNWNQERRNYAKVLSEEADKESKKDNTAEEEAVLADAAEKALSGMLAFPPQMSAEERKYCYKAVMDMIADTNAFKETKIKLSNINTSNKLPKIESDIINAIYKALISYDKTYKYAGGKYEYKIRITGISGVFTGEIHVKGITASVMINSLPANVEKAINDYLGEMIKLQKNNLRAYLISTITDMGKYLNLANPKDILKYTLAAKANDALKTFGLGDINLTLGKCAKYYDHVYQILKASEKADLTKNAQDILSALSGVMFEDYSGTLSNKALDNAIKRLTEAKNSLLRSATAYLAGEFDEYGGTVLPSSYKNYIKIYINCPVDVYVYDESCAEIGYITGEDVYSADTDAVYMEMNGDSKAVYRNEGGKISIKAMATAYGMLNYTVEEYVDGIPMGRLVFYDIDLYPDKEITADIDFDSIEEATGNFVLSDSEADIEPDECITIMDESLVEVSVVCTEGGAVYGDGYYEKGYPVSLAAVSDDGYDFAGWYNDGDLLTNETFYSFTAKEDIILAAYYVESVVFEESSVKLESLQINSGMLIPAFSPDILDYIVVIPNPVDSIEIITASNDPGIIVTGAGNHTLVEGENIISLLLTDANDITYIAYAIAIHNGDTGGVVIHGDVSGDGRINMQDVLLIYQYFRGKADFTDEQILAADVNGDGSVNMTDVLMTYQYFRGKITKFTE